MLLIVIILICLGIIAYLIFSDGINYSVFSDKGNEVQSVEVEGISISESDVSLVIGETHQLITTILPNNASNA